MRDSRLGERVSHDGEHAAARDGFTTVPKTCISHGARPPPTPTVQYRAKRQRYTAPMSPHRLLAALLAVAVGTSGCTAYHPIETTPEGIRRSVAPGDTVRLRTRQEDEVRLLVIAIDDREMRGREDVESRDTRTVRFDAISSLDVQRPSMRRTVLAVVLPVVAGLIIACNNSDCRTRSGVDIER